MDFDGATVDVVMLVIGCENDQTGHLAALSNASKRLRLSSRSLRSASRETELRSTFDGLTAAA